MLTTLGTSGAGADLWWVLRSQTSEVDKILLLVKASTSFVELNFLVFAPRNTDLALVMSLRTTETSGWANIVWLVHGFNGYLNLSRWRVFLIYNYLCLNFISMSHSGRFVSRAWLYHVPKTGHRLFVNKDFIWRNTIVDFLLVTCTIFLFYRHMITKCFYMCQYRR